MRIDRHERACVSPRCMSGVCDGDEYFTQTYASRSSWSRFPCKVYLMKAFAAQSQCSSLNFILLPRVETTEKSVLSTIFEGN